MLKFILLRSSIATLVAWAGGATGAAFGGVRRSLDFLVAAALGALLAVTLLDILPDAARLLSLPTMVAAVISGTALFWLVATYIYPICPACAIGQLSTPSSDELKRTAVLLSIALGIHSTMDGAAVVIGDTIAHGANGGVFLAVSLHKFPEGIALVLLLIGAGVSRAHALLYTVCIESATEVGALGALLLVGRLPPAVLGFVFANIGGGFLYLVVAAAAADKHKQSPNVERRSLAIPALYGAAGFAFTSIVIAVGEVLSR